MNAPAFKALLINPPSGLYRRDDRCQSRVEDQTVRVIFPPVDLALLGAIVKRQNGLALLRDYPAMGATTLEQVVEEVRTFSPDWALLNFTTATLEKDLETARRIKAICPGCKVVARSEFFEREGESLLEQRTELDLALYGEIEENWESLLQGKDPVTLSALLYRHPEKGIQRNGGRARVENLDLLPQPDRSLLDNGLYRSPETGNPLTVIQAGRGCPSRCIFCPAGSASGYRLRTRSPHLLVEEIRDCVERYGIREFLFNGDTFTMKKKWLLELCQGIVDAGLDIRWGCNSRVDTMDRDRAEALRRAGCWVVAFGVESGDAGMLEKMGKGSCPEQAEAAFAVCREAGLATHAFCIIGLPWESRESLQKTERHLRRLDPDFFDINVAYPLPGTSFYEMAQEMKLLEGEGSYAQAAVHSLHLSAEELTAWRKKTLLKLYFRPAYILRTLGGATRNGTLKSYGKAGWERLKGLLKG